MKTLYIYIILLVLSSNLYSQSMDNKLKSACKKFDYKELVRNLNDYQINTQDKFEFQWGTTLNREILNDYIEELLSIEERVQDKEDLNIYTVYFYKIKLIRKGNKICYFKITRTINEKVNHSWVPKEIQIQEKKIAVPPIFRTTFSPLIIH